MIKQFLKLMAIAVFISGIEAIANAQKITHLYNAVAQVKQINQETPIIDLVLPDKAQVILKGDGTKSGRLIKVDSKNKQIQLEHNGHTGFVNITDIKEILLNGVAIVEGRKVVIRGNDNINLESLEEKLINFEITNSENGEATLKLTSTDNLEEVMRKNQDNFFILKEMSFEPPEMINIKYKVQP